MLPTSSSTDLVGSNVRSATALNNGSRSSLKRPAAGAVQASHSLRHARAEDQLRTGAMDPTPW
jgi:hypothetical protein